MWIGYLLYVHGNEKTLRECKSRDIADLVTYISGLPETAPESNSDRPTADASYVEQPIANPGQPAQPTVVCDGNTCRLVPPKSLEERIAETKELMERRKREKAEKDKEEEFAIYAMVERMAPEIISRERKIYKGVSPNVDFYSGLTYSMLGIPEELFTPIFAIARIVGWSAHRLEELINMDKIIRPAYMSVQDRREYVRIDDRG